MLVLLAPSEGKTAPRRGKPLDLGTLVHPELTSRREAVLDALAELCAGSPEAAMAALGLSPSQAGELERATVHPLPDAGHFIQEDAPEEIAAAIRSWWAQWRP